MCLKEPLGIPSILRSPNADDDDAGAQFHFLRISHCLPTRSEIDLLSSGLLGPSSQWDLGIHRQRPSSDHLADRQLAAVNNKLWYATILRKDHSVAWRGGDK